MVELQLKGPCYNCDENYFPQHKCKEQNIFMAISEDVAKEEVEFPPVEEISPPYATTSPTDPTKVESLISLHALH
jgi:hypothetical protein